jgi:hypothetical protein
MFSGLKQQQLDPNHTSPSNATNEDAYAQAPVRLHSLVIGTTSKVKCDLMLVRVLNWNLNNKRITNFVSHRFSLFSKSFILNICKHHYAKHVYFT